MGLVFILGKGFIYPNDRTIAGSQRKRCKILSLVKSLVSDHKSPHSFAVSIMAPTFMKHIR